MNDAGKVAFTPKGDYLNAVTYEYLDTVVYNGNAYAALKTTTGNAPTDSDTDENWKLLARGGTSVPVAKEETTGVVKASSDIGVSDDGSMILKTDYISQESLAELTSGESRTTFFGKIAKAVSTLISHITTSATSSVLGHVKLTNSVSSTSTSTAAVPASVKKAYDLANVAVPTANISQSSAITETGTYVLDAVEKNASVEGTMAYDIAELNSNLDETISNVIAIAGQMEGIRRTSVHYVTFNNTNFAFVDVSTYIPSGYKIADYCMALGCINSYNETNASISWISKKSNSQFTVKITEIINASVHITLQYTLVPA